MQSLPCLSPFTDSTYPPNQPHQLLFHQFSPQPRSGPLQALGPPRGPPLSPHATESFYPSHVPILHPRVFLRPQHIHRQISHPSPLKGAIGYSSHQTNPGSIPDGNAIIHDDDDDVTPSSLHPALTLAAPIQSDEYNSSHPTSPYDSQVSGWRCRSLVQGAGAPRVIRVGMSRERVTADKGSGMEGGS